MAGDPDSSTRDRALIPPGYQAVEAPRWVCPDCGYSTPGTIDEPYAGDGACPDHPRRALILAGPGPQPGPSGPVIEPAG